MLTRIKTKTSYIRIRSKHCTVYSRFFFFFFFLNIFISFWFYGHSEASPWHVIIWLVCRYLSKTHNKTLGSNIRSVHPNIQCILNFFISLSWFYVLVGQYETKYKMKYVSNRRLALFICIFGSNIQNITKLYGYCRVCCHRTYIYIYRKCQYFIYSRKR